MKKLLYFIFPIVVFGGDISTYKIPPSQTTSGYVPVISDDMMKKCVEIYNQAENLEKTLSITQVNQYSSYEVNMYNQSLRNLNDMTNWFNQNCAGKQSHSACKATNELNRQNGLPTQNCGG